MTTCYDDDDDDNINEPEKLWEFTYRMIGINAFVVIRAPSESLELIFLMEVLKKGIYWKP